MPGFDHIMPFDDAEKARDFAALTGGRFLSGVGEGEYQTTPPRVLNQFETREEMESFHAKYLATP